MSEPATRTYLVPTHVRTGEQASRVDVTGKTEQSVDLITRGMLRNMDTDNWFVDEITETP
jgi:hypothetical protein